MSATKTVKTGKFMTEFERTEDTDKADYATKKAQDKYFNDTPNAGKDLYESIKNVVKDSMVNTIVTRESNKQNADKLKRKK